MKRHPRVVLSVITAAVLAVPLGWSVAAAQQAGAVQAQEAKPAPPAAAPPREVPPATKALNDANALKDVDEKIAAIRKVIVDFPKTPQVGQANTLLLSALIKKGDADAVREQARVIVAGADESSRSRLQRDVASTLLNGDLLLEDAETYAKTAVDQFPDEKAYVEARKQEAAARAASRQAQGANSAPGAPAAAGGTAGVTPSGAMASNDDLFVARYKSEKQSTLSTLGQVYAKRGNAAEAEKVLREAYLLDKKSAAATTIALKLAEFSKAAGRDAEQYDYLASVALAGRLTPEAHADFQAVYRKLHNGSLDGLEEALDARYEKDGPKAPEVTRYERAADRSERLVLAEIFTGSGCPPCVAADLAFESAMHRYAPTDLAVLMYHMHVPRPDPMTNPYTVARSKFYAVSGVPTYAIDGESKSGGGGAENALPMFKKSVEPVVDRRLTVTSEAGLALKASSTGQAVKATVTVTPGDTKATRLRLHLVLAEEQVRYSGENGVRFHPMVVRSMAADGVEPPKPAAAPAADAAGARPAAPAGGASAAKPAAPALPVPVLGFALEPGKGRTLVYTFDLAKVAAEGLANLEDLEKNSTRFLNYKFVQKKNEVNAKKLLLVAFVQDEDSKQVLQAVQVRLQ
jgi:tetratricopeptide (TPR) repeat protein